MSEIAMESWHSYPSIFAIGHRALSAHGLLDHDVIVEEKVDGSQFSFGINRAGEIMVRSKGAILHVDAPERMFAAAVDTVKKLAPALRPGWTYRAEYLAKPKHNTLAYSRIPRRHLIVFDINTGHEEYLSPSEKRRACEYLGLECVPVLHVGKIESAESLLALLDRESALGGCKIEGVVVKPRDYGIFGADKKVVMGKFVSEAFKEIHGKEWKRSNPASGDILEMLGERYRVEARWQKAANRLRDEGMTEGSPRDIGKLIASVQADLEKECREDAATLLMKWAWPHVLRKASQGLPEWYKRQLAESAFSQTETLPG